MISIKNLKNFEGEEVSLKAWVYQIRSSGKIAFLILRDGTDYSQVVFTKDNEKAFQTLSKLSLETSVEVKGKVRAWKNGFEIEGKDLEIIGDSIDYPIAKKSHGIDFLMNHRHLWIRSKKQKAIMEIRNEIIYRSHEFFYKEKFLKIDSPIFTPNSCEETSSLFSVDFFDRKIYLSQSGQLYMEAAAAAYNKVYCFGPSFRAEKSSTRRHLLEFWMIEPEMAFQTYENAMELAEKFVKYLTQSVLDNQKEALDILERDKKSLEKILSPFIRISYEEACSILKKEKSDFKEGKDFGGGEETLISSCFNVPVFVYHFPKNIKAFYMKEDEKNSNLSLSFDLLGTEGFGEIIGGGQREDDLNKLKEKLNQHGLSEKEFSWYLDLRKYGSFPHSGFGLGVERMVSWICNLDHVREAIPFPRLYGRSFFEERK